jgi:hypothetical protein
MTIILEQWSNGFHHSQVTILEVGRWTTNTHFTCTYSRVLLSPRNLFELGVPAHNCPLVGNMSTFWWWLEVCANGYGCHCGCRHLECTLLWGDQCQWLLVNPALLRAWLGMLLLIIPTDKNSCSCVFNRVNFFSFLKLGRKFHTFVWVF